MLVGIIIASIALALGIVWFIVSQNKYYDKISFKETLDLVNVPLITFQHVDKNNNLIKLNFVIDTGAVGSLLDIKCLENCELVDLGLSNKNYGLDGNPKSNDLYGIDLMYKDKVFSDVVMVNDFPIFARMKEATGVTVHGLLGSSFLDKYKYVVDFNKYLLYSKGRR